jgi:hypothetical protein
MIRLRSGGPNFIFGIIKIWPLKPKMDKKSNCLKINSRFKKLYKALDSARDPTEN